MNIKDVIAIEEVSHDLDTGENLYESQDVGIGVYFRDCIIADIESLWLYAGVHPKKNRILSHAINKISLCNLL